MPYGTMEASYKDADALSTLTSEQALADFATLVTDLKRNLSAEASPVVLFGGSYGGSRSSFSSSMLFAPCVLCVLLLMSCLGVSHIRFVCV